MILGILIVLLVSTSTLLAWQVCLFMKEIRERRGPPPPRPAPRRPPPPRANPWAPFDVRPGMGPAELVRQYRRLARRHHPDRGGDPRMMARINALYAQLRRQGDAAPRTGGGTPNAR